LNAAGLRVVRGKKLGLGGLKRGVRLLGRSEVRFCGHPTPSGGEHEEEARGAGRAERSFENVVIHACRITLALAGSRSATRANLKI